MLERLFDVGNHKGTHKNPKKEEILQKYGLEKGVIILSPHHLEEICHYGLLRKNLGNEAYRSMLAIRKFSLADLGYPEEYVKNYEAIVETFHKNPDLRITIVTGYDSMCAYCNKNLAWCNSDIFVGTDAKVALEYNLNECEYSAEELRIIFEKTSNR